MLDNRYDPCSTIVTSQLPVDNWYELIGDPTLADAIFGRLVHNAYHINLKGESMRKKAVEIDDLLHIRLTMPPLRRCAALRLLGRT